VKLALEKSEACAGEERSLRWRRVKLALEKGEACTGEE
jgi:hypothetical protein